MEDTIEKWQEPPPAKIVRPLPAPDMEQKKRRGGKRWRKQKERLATTEMMKFANRMKFNEVEEEFIDMDETFGLGMLGAFSAQFVLFFILSVLLRLRCYSTLVHN